MIDFQKIYNFLNWIEKESDYHHAGMALVGSSSSVYIS